MRIMRSFFRRTRAASACSRVPPNDGIELSLNCRDSESLVDVIIVAYIDYNLMPGGTTEWFVRIANPEELSRQVQGQLGNVATH